MWFHKHNALNEKTKVIEDANRRTEQFEKQLEELQASKPAREKVRAEASLLREKSEQQHDMNHFGEALKIAMHKRRGARDA